MPVPEPNPGEAQPAQKPRKRIIILSLGSFWWRVIKDSLKHSREPFEHITTYLAIVAGAVVWLLILHLINQEWVDSTIYWTLAIPFAVWAIWLAWNLIKMPHKIYKTDIAAAQAGAEVQNDRKTAFANFALFFSVTLVIGAFFGIWIVKNQEIVKIKKQIPIVAKKGIPKPLPDKIIPPPQPPPMPVVSTQSVSSAIAETKFETDAPLDDVSDSFEKTLAAQRAAEKQKEYNDQTNAQTEWNDNLNDRYYLLQCLRDTLRDQANQLKDGVVMTKGYLQSIPKTINLKDEQFTIAEIGFQIKTNVHFVVSVAPAPINAKSLKISSSCGEMNFRSLWGRGGNPELMLQVPQFNYNVGKVFKDSIPHDFIQKQVEFFVGAQIRTSVQTNQ